MGEVVDEVPDEAVFRLGLLGEETALIEALEGKVEALQAALQQRARRGGAEVVVLEDGEA